MSDDPLRVPLRPQLVKAGLRELLVERHQQPHQLAPDGAVAEDVGKLGEGDQPVRVPGRPVRIIAIDDPVDPVVRLPRLVKQRGDSLGALVHRGQAGMSRTGSVFSWLTNADSTYVGRPAS